MHMFNKIIGADIAAKLSVTWFGMWVFTLVYFSQFSTEQKVLQAKNCKSYLKYKRSLKSVKNIMQTKQLSCFSK